MNRPLTTEEEWLVRWMLEHGNPDAGAFLPQMEKLQVTPWRCLCGCASIEFSVDGRPRQSGSMHVLADFTFGCESEVCGIFVYETCGFLAGVEVYGLNGDAPTTLPPASSLKPISELN